jgi:hypothetical protein
MSNEILDKIWSSFFLELKNIGFDALNINYLTIENMINNDPFMYLGLVGNTVFEICKQSVSVEGFAFKNSQTVTLNSLDGKDVDILHKMNKIKRYCKDLDLDKNDIDLLYKILYNGGEDNSMIIIESKDKSIILHRLAGNIQDVSIIITQTQIFREKFNTVLIEIVQKWKDHQKNEVKEEVENNNLSGYLETKSNNDPEDIILHSTLTSIYNLAERCLISKHIKIQDLDNEEVVVKLLMFCIFVAITRSLDIEGIKLGLNDSIINYESCPENRKDLFLLLINLKINIKKLNLSKDKIEEYTSRILEIKDISNIPHGTQLVKIVHTVYNIDVFKRNLFQIKNLLKELHSGVLSTLMCTKCTFLNPMGNVKCSMCLSFI